MSDKAARHFCTQNMLSKLGVLSKPGSRTSQFVTFNL